MRKKIFVSVVLAVVLLMSFSITAFASTTAVKSMSGTVANSDLSNSRLTNPDSNWTYMRARASSLSGYSSIGARGVTISGAYAITNYQTLSVSSTFAYLSAHSYKKYDMKLKVYNEDENGDTTYTVYFKGQY